MEGYARIIWELAYHPHAPKPPVKNGALDRVYAALAKEGLKVAQVFRMNSTAIKARPDAHRARKKGERATSRAHGG